MQSSSVTAPRIPLSRSAVTLATPPQSPPAHEIAKLTTTVPRQYVHRAAISEVFLTGWETGDPDGFIVRGQWPRGHAVFAPRFGQQDPLLIAETIRQGGTLLAHTEYGVPLGHHFLMSDLAYTSVRDALTAEPVPSEVELHITCHDITRRGKQVVSMLYRVHVWVGQIRVAVASAAYKTLSPSVYRRIRGDRPFTSDITPPPAIDPALVGRRDPRDVVLADAAAGPGDPAHSWLLRADTSHPLFFDHPVDHVPGMLLLEAARQAAQAAMHPVPVQALGMASSFAHYAEFDTPCRIDAEVGQRGADGNTPVQITGTQSDQTVFTCTVTTRPLD
ncbi:ScbA/BarX family gamma-butyrolactone biosynthesis protein [Streptantibioticus ferralitis]|uniref:ScbA/BarX family gamma-butyrolactone biosynthesis protein n=1 Tax=Streptantibioticus ferralitis TaxID=236510 RepID=A0ABT5Z9F9_9ACTN|nr:ScbA/BarX family gamma-butyrolactone biosynthesis protein [Streptantibioticus ferralitis]MDF2260474.1 ScbA/BarX family gamma-butyrolactone biosynthesis protein [Streptantibioticus ferralitis]